MPGGHIRRGLASLALVVATGGFVGCGGGDPSSQGSSPAAPPLTVPGYSGTPKVAKPKAEAPGADTEAAANARTDERKDEQAAGSPPASASSPPAPTTTAPTETTPVPSSGADAATAGEFRAFCANNPGAC